MHLAQGVTIGNWNTKTPSHLIVLYNALSSKSYFTEYFVFNYLYELFLTSLHADYQSSGLELCGVIICITQEVWELSCVSDSVGFISLVIGKLGLLCSNICFLKCLRTVFFCKFVKVDSSGFIWLDRSEAQQHISVGILHYHFINCNCSISFLYC